MNTNEDMRLKGLNFAKKGSMATMLFCLLFEVVFLFGAILKFFPVPVVIPVLTAIVFFFGLVIYILSIKNIYSPVIPYIITTVTATILTFCLSFIQPQLRIPFFLIYFYIILHPGYLLGIKNGIYAIALVDFAYVLMLVLTQNLYPEINLGMELVKLIFLTFVSFLLIIDFDRDLVRLKELREILKKVEQGDLNVHIEEKGAPDEIYFLGRTIKTLVETEANIIKLVVDTSKQLSEISAQIASTSNELSTAISEIVSTTQKMTEGVDR
ncbi:MAG: HAMP domain-containing protein, partial [candidate division WOR-3 bacterium]